MMVNTLCIIVFAIGILSYVAADIYDSYRISNLTKRIEELESQAENQRQLSFDLLNALKDDVEIMARLEGKISALEEKVKNCGPWY